MIKASKVSQINWWLGGWLFINLLQALLSPIDADEAYYWMYASQLDWGYFDHPPAVAALIAIGKDWLPGALGLRFGHVLAGTITIWAIWDLLDRPTGKKGLLALLLITAQPMLQVYGFIATPDAPLLLFTALLLRQYKKFLQQPNVQAGLVMGLLMAALLYSKYHGLILILFIALPNLRWLIRQPSAWLAAGFGALLYIPHLYWQYVHDFPSFRYHLSGRNDPYELKYTLEYLGNNLVIFNPFFVYFYVKALWQTTKEKASESKRFYHSQRWLVLITLAFFLYSTFKGGTEAQWTAMLCIPLVYLLYNYLAKAPKSAAIASKLAWLTLGLFLIARLLLVLPQEWLPFNKPFNAKPWVEELVQIADGRPVVFENSYRDPSHYQFYSGQTATTFTDAFYRPNQFDIWRNDTLLHGKEVLFVSKDNWKWPDAIPFTPQTKRLKTIIIEDFQIAKFLRFTNKTILPDTLKTGQKLDIELYVHNQERFTVDIDGNLPLKFYIIYQDIDGIWSYQKLSDIRLQEIKHGEPQLLFKGSTQVPYDLVLKDQVLQFGASYDGLPPLRGQSELHQVEIISHK